MQSLGMAFLFVPISTAAFARIPKDRTNYAAGLFNLARNIGGSSGLATVTTLLSRRSQFHQSVLTSHVTTYDAPYREMIAGTTAVIQGHGASAPDAARQAHGILYGMVQRHSAMLAFADAFWLMAVLFLAVLPLMLMMKRAPAGPGPAEIAAH